MPNTKILESGKILPNYYDSETGKPVAEGTEGARTIYKLITDGAETNLETELLNSIVDIVFVEKTNAYGAAHPDEYKEAVDALAALDAKDKEAPAVAVAEVSPAVTTDEDAAPAVAVAEVAPAVSPAVTTDEDAAPAEAVASVMTKETIVAPAVAAEEAAAAPLVAATHEYNSNYLQITPTQLMLGVCGVLAFGICLGNSLQDHCHPHDFHDL